MDRCAPIASGSEGMKLLRQFGEQLLAWTVIVILGAIILGILELLKL